MSLLSHWHTNPYGFDRIVHFFKHSTNLFVGPCDPWAKVNIGKKLHRTIPKRPVFQYFFSVDINRKQFNVRVVQFVCRFCLWTYDNNNSYLIFFGQTMRRTQIIHLKNYLKFSLSCCSFVHSLYGIGCVFDKFNE